MTRNDNTRFSYKYVQRQWTDWKPVYSLKIITKFYHFLFGTCNIECIQRSYCIFKRLRVRSIKDVSFPPLQSNSPYSFCKVIFKWKSSSQERTQTGISNWSSSWNIGKYMNSILNSKISFVNYAVIKYICNIFSTKVKEYLILCMKSNQF